MSGRYVRVYYSIIDDPKFETVYGDDHRLAAWLRLLMTADALWPAPAPIPRLVMQDALDDLVGVRLIELLPGDHFRVHGLDREREARTVQASEAGKARARAQDAPRDGGRFTSGPPAAHQRALVTPPANRTEQNKEEKSKGRAGSATTTEEEERPRRVNGPDPVPMPLADVILGMGLTLPAVVVDPPPDPPKEPTP